MAGEDKPEAPNGDGLHVADASSRLSDSDLDSVTGGLTVEIYAKQTRDLPEVARFWKTCARDGLPVENQYPTLKK